MKVAGCGLRFWGRNLSLKSATLQPQLRSVSGMVQKHFLIRQKASKCLEKTPATGEDCGREAIIKPVNGKPNPVQ